jgi:hypothetical protein
MNKHKKNQHLHTRKDQKGEKLVMTNSRAHKQRMPTLVTWADA